MKRSIKIALISILSLVLWIALLLYVAPREDVFPEIVFNILLTLPVSVPVLFGVYLLFCLIIGVKNFKTVPEEAENLRKDIARAKKALEAAGVSTGPADHTGKAKDA